MSAQSEQLMIDKIKADLDDRLKLELYETGHASVINHCHAMIELFHQNGGTGNNYSDILGMLISIEVAVKKVGES